MNLLLWNSICRNSLNYLYLILFSQRLTNHKSQQNYREKRLISSQNSAIFQKKCSKAQRKKKMNTRLISNKFKKLWMQSEKWVLQKNKLKQPKSPRWKLSKVKSKTAMKPRNRRISVSRQTGKSQQSKKTMRLSEINN